MRIKNYHLLAFILLVGIPLLAFSGWAAADPPLRVARLGYSTGSVNFSPAGETYWDEAIVNLPLTTGDRLWTSQGEARTEIQAGGATIRMSANTGLAVLNLDDQTLQLQLIQGVLNVRVRHLEPEQVFEIDTPNLAFTLRKPGAYRIEVDPDTDATTVIVRKGKGEAYGEGASYIIDYKRAYRFTGTTLGDYEYIDDPRFDDFDRWSEERDRITDGSISARYVSRDVIGYQDLDDNGRWRDDATYGKVWFPTNVDADWAPYRDGHWAWIDPWGWTWVDDAPWGFTVSHYGRWTNLQGSWGWVPGPRTARAYYAPALVVFLGGADLSLAIGGGETHGTAWFPLGPREIYRPAYKVSLDYFEGINYSNTTINRKVLRTHYDQPDTTHVVYANRRVTGAVIAVPTTLFASSRRVSKSAVQLSVEISDKAPLGFAPHVVPTEQSVRGAAARGGHPPERLFERPVVARRTPPPAHPGFAAQMPHLAAKPGKPLDEESRKVLRAEQKAMPSVKVIPKERVVKPTEAPPKPTHDPRSDAKREAPPKPTHDPRGDAKSEAPPKPSHDPRSDAKSEAPPKPTHDPRSDAKPEAPPKATHDPRSDAKPQPVAKPKSAAPQPNAADPSAAPTQPPPQSAPTAEEAEQGSHQQGAPNSGRDQPKQQDKSPGQGEQSGQGQQSGEGGPKWNKPDDQSPEHGGNKHQ
jgi:hypothetical protein